MLGWIVGAAIDPLKIGWAVYLIFRPKAWPTALTVAAIIGAATAYLSSLGVATLTFGEWLPSNLIASIVLASVGNFVGQKRTALGDKNR